MRNQELGMSFARNKVLRSLSLFFACKKEGGTTAGGGWYKVVENTKRVPSTIPSEQKTKGEDICPKYTYPK